MTYQRDQFVQDVQAELKECDFYNRFKTQIIVCNGPKHVEQLDEHLILHFYRQGRNVLETRDDIYENYEEMEKKGIITELYEDIRKREDLHQKEKNRLFPDQNVFTQEEMAKLPPRPSNKELGLMCQYEWLHENPPEKTFVYVTEETGPGYSFPKEITNAFGVVIGKVLSYGRRIENYTPSGGQVLKQHLQVKGTNGAYYQGWYYLSSGTYARLYLTKQSKQVRRQKRTLMTATIDKENQEFINKMCSPDQDSIDKYVNYLISLSRKSESDRYEKMTNQYPVYISELKNRLLKSGLIANDLDLSMCYHKNLSIEDSVKFIIHKLRN